MTRIHIRAGPQLMDAETALRYARSRHDSNDFSRAERQQRVIAATKRRIGDSGDLPRLANLVDELSDAVRTDLDPANALQFLRFALSIPAHEVERALLRPQSDTGPGELRELNENAGYYLVPVRSAIARLVAEVFYDPRVRAEAARAEVRAPSARPALGQELGEDLARRRYRVARVAATKGGQRTTVILRNPEKRYSAEQLAKVAGATLVRGSADADVDVVLVVGDDFRGLASGDRP